MTETFIKERKHTDRAKSRRSASTMPARSSADFTNGSLGHLRIDPLRPRPQGALHVRDQRRDSLDRLGPARPAPAAVLRPPRRSDRPRLAAAFTSPTATIPTWATGGCRACRSATSTRSSIRSPTSSTASQRKASRPTFRDALETQKVCDAVLASASTASGRRWDNLADCKLATSR